MFGIGVVVVVALAFGLLTMRNFGRQIIVALPLPHQILELYDRFEEGVFGALVARHLPRLGLMTGLIWMTEALRLYLVVQALGFADVSLGLSGAVFVALIGSLLTAVPLSPAGLGIVEAGVVGVLHVAYGVPLPEATAIALLDRVISVFSIIVFGSIAYAVSTKPRGMGRIDGPADTSDGIDPGVTFAPAGREPLATRGGGPTRPCHGISTTLQSDLELRGVLSYQVLRVGRPHPTVDDPTPPSRSSSLPPRGRPVPTGDTGVLPPSASSWHRGTGPSGNSTARGTPVGAPRQHDHAKRPSVQRMASSPAQGQEDVAAAIGPAVGSRSLDDLPLDPR